MAEIAGVKTIRPSVNEKVPSKHLDNGHLPDGWTIKELLKEHMSEPYNPLIANAFFRTGDIEAWGRGIAMIRDACRKNGTDFPTFEFGPTSMMVEFKGTVPGTGESQGKTLVETPEKTPEKILKALQEDPQRSLTEVATMIGKSASAVERASRRLQETGKLRRVGPNKGGHWEVLEQTTR